MGGCFGAEDAVAVQVVGASLVLVEVVSGGWKGGMALRTGLGGNGDCLCGGVCGGVCGGCLDWCVHGNSLSPSERE